MRNDSLLVTASNDTSLRVYSIAQNTHTTNQSNPDVIDSLDDVATPIMCNYSGLIQRTGKGKTVNLIADPTGTILGCNGTSQIVEMFYFCDEAEIMTRLAKRMKKLLKSSEADLSKNNEVSLADKIKRLPTVKVEEKIKSFDILIGSAKEARIVVSTANNSIKLFSVDFGAKNAEASLLRSVQQGGHRTETRTVAFSSDNLTIASGSSDQIKLWSSDTQTCLRTVDVSYALSICFVPGDRYLIVGLKSGQLLIVDILIGEVIETIAAHEKEIWAIVLQPDQKGCVTGSNDRTVKFWSFELIEDPTSFKKLLSLLHKSTLALDEPVLCIKLSKNNKFIAVALLDNTVKLFFADTFKLYLSLYGHSLPVLCMDISCDSSLIVTGSADRNIKIWGMDFGDCHRSLFAHEDSVMAVQFIPKTHMFYSCGKDGKIKQWDADIFQKILTLPGHIGEAYNLAVSSNGKLLVTTGVDRTLRLFERTDEPLVLQDEQEEEREMIENRTLATGEDSSIPNLPNLKLASRKTIGAERAAESILECLEVSTKFDTQDNKNDIPALMVAYEAKNPNEFLINVLRRIRASDLEESLVLLPFASVCDILRKIPHLLATRNDQVEMLCKVVLFIFKIHQKPILSNQTLLNTVRDIHGCLETAIVDLKDLFGYNLHALQLLQSNLELNEGIELFKDASKVKRIKHNKQKKREMAKRVHIQMST